MGSENRAINAINSTAALNDTTYVSTDFGIKKTDDETRNIISSTFGMLKNNLEAFWYSTGLDPNVNNAYANTMSSEGIEVQGKKFYQHPGVGNLHPYNEMGNPSGGCFTLHTMG